MLLGRSLTTMGLKIVVLTLLVVPCHAQEASRNLEWDTDRTVLHQSLNTAGPSTGGPGGVPNQAITTDFNWSLSSKSLPPLTAGVKVTLTLAPCPKGADTTGNTALGGPNGAYPIYISDSNPESVYVRGGNCASGASSGTLVFTPYFSHSPGAYTLMSASAGIQEAINATCGTNTTTWHNAGCTIIIPPSGPWLSGHGYNIYGTIYFHASQSVLSGFGATLNCQPTLRGPCLQIGNLTSSIAYNNDTVMGLSFRSPTKVSSNPAYAGSLISATQKSRGTVTITTTANHNLRTGDMVNIQFTDSAVFWGDVPSITVTSPTTFTYARGSNSIARQSTPGVVALSYEPILDNAQKTHFIDIHYDPAGESGHFNHFFDFWDDEEAIIDGFNNAGISLDGNSYWTGSFVYSGGSSNLPSTSQQLAPVITLKNSNITANGSNCVTDLNSNGLYVSDTVCQATGPWQFKVSNSTGNYQGGSFRNIYAETSTSLNAAGWSPWGGLGNAGLIGGPIGGALGLGFYYKGTASGGGFEGDLPIVGSGSTQYVYYIVVHDGGAVTSPLPVMYLKQDSLGAATLRWPRVANSEDTITYDGIRCQSAYQIGGAAGSYVAPYGSLPGGSTAACGSIFTGQAQQPGFIQSFNDNTSNNTSAYTLNLGNWGARPDFWPGNAVLSSTPLQSDFEMPVTGIGFYGGPTVIAPFCGYGVNVNGGWTSCYATQVASNNAIVNDPPLLLQDGAVAGGGWLSPPTKGRLNFIMSPTELTEAAHHIITLVDTNPAKTMATSTHRPSADATDSWIGIDSGNVNPSAVTLAIGSPVAISEYINNVGDNSHWKEKLTATAKTFNVPIVMQSVTFANLPSSPVNGERLYCSDCTVTTPASCMNVTTAAACSCKSGGTGAEAKRINGKWLCN